MIGLPAEGSIELDNGKSVHFKKIDDPAPLMCDIKKRAEEAKNVRAANPSLDSISENDNYNNLVKLASIELKRLKSPFTFFAGDKIKALETALLNVRTMSIFMGDEELKQTSYKQLAKESGLIDALNMHRFSWSSKAKTQAPTRVIENIEKAVPGLAKVI
ncbi:MULTISPECIES: hypothetical protein [unclassified Legionella]|uniref:hypothetical protein n=1 Tax=unclassified Legionella TaxID=2622702 RepID=UPI001056CCD1|nr:MULTISPECIES: hypothetical protein [unclassified Legionella]MDI9818032.1 hypothetical protein [Legionella sp. PL877]